VAIDRKYGRVTLENGSVGEDEPVVVFRAADVLLPKVLACYRQFCVEQGSSRFHQDLVSDAREKVRTWQLNNPGKVKTPNSAEFEAQHQD
jgi:hypothetical protein